MDGIQLALCALGAFYVFAGHVATKAALTSHIVDLAIAAIGGGKPSRTETAQSYWLLAAAGLILAGGVALMFLIDIAAWLFLASAIGQALYLGYVAPRFFDVEDEPDASGRRASINAFIIYLAATALVVWALSAGKLTSWQDVGWLMALPAALIAAHVAYVVRALAGSPATDSPMFAPSEEDEPARDPAQSKRIKVMADYFTHPLWALDEDTFGDIAPEQLALSPELAKDLNAWAEAFTASFDPESPAESRWSEAERVAHEAMARPLAVRLARERPDRMIYVMQTDAGVVEVHAGEEP